MQRLWWMSVVRSGAVSLLVIAALVALAYFLGIYFLAIIGLSFVVVYRRDLLGGGKLFSEGLERRENPPDPFSEFGDRRG